MTLEELLDFLDEGILEECSSEFEKLKSEYPEFDGTLSSEEQIESVITWGFSNDRLDKLYLSLRHYLFDVDEGLVDYAMSCYIEIKYKDDGTHWGGKLFTDPELLCLESNNKRYYFISSTWDDYDDEDFFIINTNDDCEEVFDWFKEYCYNGGNPDERFTNEYHFT